MPAFTATAPGKIILFGEHAVVYGRPAIAVPVNQVQARAVVTPAPKAPSGSIRILAPDIDLESDLSDLPHSHPLALALNLVIQDLGLKRVPACQLRVTSSIPVAAGMGSGAAVTVAIIRAFSAFLGRSLSKPQTSDLAFEVEKLYHGTPSGIDNTVVTYSQPVYFVHGQPIKILNVPEPFSLVIADSGIASPTALTVGDVRKAWQENPERYDELFDGIALVVQRARQTIETGHPNQLGSLMDANQEYLRQIGVSSPELEGLIQAAKLAGVLGAKLSGGGRGGNMIALATSDSAPNVAQVLLTQGAVRTFITKVGK